MAPLAPEGTVRKRQRRGFISASGIARGKHAKTIASAESAIQRFAVDDGSTKAISATQRRTGYIGRWGQTGVIFNHFAEALSLFANNPFPTGLRSLSVPRSTDISSPSRATQPPVVEAPTTRKLASGALSRRSSAVALLEAGWLGALIGTRRFRRTEVWLPPLD